MVAKHKEATDKLTSSVEELQSKLTQAEMFYQQLQEQLDETTTNNKLLEVLLLVYLHITVQFLYAVYSKQW